MIKIVVNGVQIEVDSTKEAVDLIKGFETKKEKPQVAEVKVHRKKRFSTKAYWTDEELKRMLNYQHTQGVSPSEIARDNTLRSRHSRHGIISMYHKLATNKGLSRKVINQLKSII